MQLSEEQATEVKAWVVRKLEDISDADSDVLADYVLALIRSDAPDEEIRKVSVENLEDFLREHTTQFVEELFSTFGPKQQPSPHAHPQLPQDVPPSAPEPQQPLPFNTSAAPDAPHGLPSGGFPQQQSAQDGANYSRKRSFNEDIQADQEQEGAPYNRAFKTPRRGRGGGRGDWMGRDGRAPPGQYPPQAPGFPMMPAAFPPFNQNDPMGSMMSLQAMGFPQMPGMPPMPMPPGQQPDQMPKSGERCPFYETQGICYLGAGCPYQHGPEMAGAKDDEYDPKTSNIVMDVQRRGDGHMRGGDRGRGRGRGDRGGFGPRGRRAEFSAVGPSEDTTITTIVVEQIPEDKFEEGTVRDFFSQYGEIVDITMQPHRKLALITYDTHASAKQAWSSPKVIFDNRFVKVYWYKPKAEKNGDRPTSDDAHGEVPAFNREEFEKQQDEAQKMHEEKKKKRQETEEAKQALDKQREELLMKQQEEKDKLLQRIGAADSSNGNAEGEPEPAADDSANDQTKQLRAKLASLEEEAKGLGLDPSGADTGSFAPRGRGRGFSSYRGRGYAPRGRGYDPSYRGGYRGRGGFRGRGGVLRLDNRPKRVGVSGVELNSEKDEALRQFLIGVGEYESIEPDPENPNSVVVAFKERFQAEKFMFGPWTIPSVGEVQLSWVPNPPLAPAALDTKTGSDEDMTMETTTPAQSQEQLNARKEGNHEVDYDVAEMDDSWGVE
ncbi:hypothetical protein PHISP_04947 [Aspergillus sp. HF37]|nr:hypothetical protein PHISP_04947 [Aspergillus sp. HF37]